MRKTLLCLLASCALQAQAHDTYFNPLDEYDLDSGLYFASVSDALDRYADRQAERMSGLSSSTPAAAPKVVNVFVYNPSKKQGYNVFARDMDKVSAVVIESGYNSELRRMEFLGAGARLRNNQSMAARKASGAILIETLEEATQKHTVWLTYKTGGEPKPLFTYNPPSAWHLDVRNRVIRLVKRASTGFTVTEFPWQ